MADDTKEGGAVPVFLSPIKGRLTKKNIFAFDVESYGQKNSFLMVSIVGKYLNKQGNVSELRRTFMSQDAFFDFLDSNMSKFSGRKSMGAYIFATNLGFDIGVLTKHTKYEADIKYIMKGSNVMAVKYKSVTFLDTMNFSPMSVDAQGKFLGIPKMGYPAYIKEEREPTSEEMPYIKQYNLNDCEITRAFAIYIQDACVTLGAKMKMTIASTAMDLFRRKYLKKSCLKPTEKIIEMTRHAYYGGRTEAFKRGTIKDMYYYDFNSMYPSVMRNILPDPNYQRYYAASDNSKLEYDGISEAVIISPENMKIPFLPFRSDGKLLFPVGSWTAWYSHVELRKAIELGYSVKIRQSIIYLRSDFFLKEYAEDLYKQRQQHKGDPLEFAIKIFLNSLYGKFAERNTKDNLKHISQLRISDEYTEIPGSDYAVVKEKVCPSKKKHIIPIWSVYITAYARIKLYEEFEKVGFDNVIYCDTDSIITSKELENSKELGALKLEKYISFGIIVRPKVYYINGTCKVKGVNMKGHCFEDVLDCSALRQRQFLKIKRCIKSKGKFEIGEITYFDKHVDLNDEKRSWAGLFCKDGLCSSGPIEITDGVNMKKYNDKIISLLAKHKEGNKAMFDVSDKGDDISDDEYIKNEYYDIYS